MKKTLIFLFILFFTISCSTTSGYNKKLKVSYKEFQKILSPRSIVLLEGENKLLTSLALPGDAYRKVYSYDINTQKFKLDYDHGHGVGFLSQDRTGKTIFLHIDNQGDENYQVYTYDPKTKTPTFLVGKKGFKTTFANSDQSGETLFFQSNFENKSIYSIYKMNRDDKDLVRISDGKTNLWPTLISEDGQQVIAARYLSNNENQLYRIDVKNKKSRLIFKRRNSIFRPMFFDKTNRFVYGVSNISRDRSGCARISTRSVNRIKYVIEKKAADVSCSYDEKSKKYFVSENSRGKRTLKIYNNMFYKEIPVPQLMQNQSVSAIAYDPKLEKLLVRYSAANNPGSLYFLNLKPTKDPEQKITKVLDYNRSKIDLKDLATSWDFDFESFDGMKIHGILFAKPEWKNSTEKRPLIVWPHGGPDSYESHRYNSWFQYLVLNDFAVFAPNYRGSTGYGKMFETLNDKDWGGAHIKDVVAGREAVAKLPWIDENNTFIFGGSFGGYSTLAAISFHPKAFKAAVGFIAIGNLETFLKSIPPDEAWQTEFRREMGDPIKDKQLYVERSPFYHVDKVSIPLQIYQAENDVRTVKSEMDAYVNELKKQGKDVDYTVLKDVGHGLARPESRKKVLEGTVRFFKSISKSANNSTNKSMNKEY